jgi:hypothetical protein
MAFAYQEPTGSLRQESLQCTRLHADANFIVRVRRKLVQCGNLYDKLSKNHFF